MNIKFLNLFLTLPLILGILAGCGKGNQAQMTPPPTEVGVVTVNAQALPIVTELPGRLDAIRTAQVRARATGILLKRDFEEGSEVKEGQLLFEIDPAPLQASLDSAQATFTKAQAAVAQTQARFNRFKSLVEAHAVSQQEFEDAQAASLQGQADLEAAKAAVENAKLNLGYASVTAPISGRIGAAKVTEGALVSQTQATELAVISQLDPIYFNFSQSSADVLRLRQALSKGKLQGLSTDEAKVSLVLEDGTVYSLPGKLLFSEITVDPSTGMVNLRAQFPNPDHLLLPGMFGRVRVEQAINANAIAAPQRAVALGAGGSATVLVVGADNKVELRSVKVDSAIGDKWIISEGLKSGETVIVEGLQKARPGAEVKPVPFNPAANENSSSVGK